MNARRSGRRANLQRQSAKAIQQLDWEIPYNRDNFTEALPPEGVAAIDDGAMRVLEEVGIVFLHDRALDIFHAAGAEVDFSSKNVRMSREMVREYIAHAPEQFTVTPRNPERTITIGGRHVIFGPVGSPPNFSNAERARQVGNYGAYLDFLKLSQYFNCIQFLTGYSVEPVDIHPSVRHLDCIRDKLLLTDKVTHAYSLGTERVTDAMEMVRIAAGLTESEFAEKPRMFTNINSTSPLKHDWPMLEGAMLMAERGQPTVVSPFTLAGAMAPVTIAGAITLQVAECLAALVLLQIIRPGLPVVMGSFTSNVDMKSGAPAFGTPEFMRAAQISGQMARHYKLPLRGSNTCAANVLDAQAAWESVFSLWGAISGGTNMVYHGAGWLEGGLHASYEKFIIDCELIQNVMYYLKPIPTTEDDIAVQAIKEVGPNGHFFGHPHTMGRYENAFYTPFLSDWRNFGTWSENGSIETPERATKIWQAILEEFEAPPMDIAVQEELIAFVERRKSEGGAPTDF